MVSRTSQHAILTSQTLADLFETISCLSNELPSEVVQDGRAIGYELEEAQIAESTGYAICIDGTVYGDGLKGVDYAEYADVIFFKDGIVNGLTVNCCNI